MNENIIIVYVDEQFAGATNDECDIWDIAQNVTNGTNRPLTDDNFPDRVECHHININRFVCDHNMYITDKLSDDTFLCRNVEECRKAAKILNKMQLETEKLEAKIRGMTL